jgi:hypothetical protein
MDFYLKSDANLLFPKAYWRNAMRPNFFKGKKAELIEKSATT